MHWLERTPLWIIGLVLLAAFLLAAQFGYGARRLSARLHAGEPDHDGLGYILSAALALLGLLIAFTFGAASDRFDTRRVLVLQEANAIGTTYLRIQALDEGPKARLSQLMVEYGRVRQGFFTAGNDTTRLRLSDASTADMQSRIWAEMVAAVRANPTATINPSLFQTTNDMFDLAASRTAAMNARLPLSILRVLVIYSLIAAAIIGYGLGQGARELLISVALFLALALAICLILDLDRERSGSVTVSQAPMAAEIESLQALEAAKLARPAPPPPAP